MLKQLIVLVAAVAAAVYVSAARAAPIPGAHFERGTWTSVDYLFIGSTAGGPGLTGLGCPFVPHDDGLTEAATSNLTINHHGWYGPQIDDSFFQRVLLRATVNGTLEDAAGNTYKVSGSFLDDGIQEIGGDLFFAGPGHVTLSGPAGKVVGTAEFRYLIGPFEENFIFTSIAHCSLRA
jgi:hypothetical protein